MKRNQFILTGIVFIASSSVFAQPQTQQKKDTTMNRTVVVEQEYNPDIVNASKINVLPQVTAPTVNKKEVEYAVTPAPSANIPAGTIQVYSGKETQPTATPGYVRLGYGNYGNLDLFGNYLFRISDRDKLNVLFRMDGMNGTLNMPNSDNREWDARYYRTRATVDYLHQFNKLNLNIAGNFGLSNFNYEPYGLDFKKQKFTSGDFHIGALSTDETMPLQFSAETNLMFYNRQLCQFFGEVNETEIRTKASVSGKINEEQKITVALKMNNLLYGTDSKHYKEAIKDIFNSRTTVDLNPYYALANDDWRLHLGANVDFSFNSGKTLRVSPDINVEYVFSDSYVVYAKATGGRQLNDFRQLEIYNPYLNPSEKVEDTYEQINTSLGFKASPFPGVWFNVFGGYQNLKDDLYQLSNSWIGGSYGDFIDLGQTNTSNLYAGIRASYQYKNLFTLSAEGSYYHWDAASEEYSYPTHSGTYTSEYSPFLWMKPEFKLGLSAEIHPISPLWINIGYEYVRRAERLYLYNKSYFPAVNDLSMGATYSLFKGVSIYVKADNLLNKKFQRYLLYPTEGINFVGGLSFKF